MTSINKKRAMAIFIGVVMLASVGEIALLRTSPDNGQGGITTTPDVVNRKLTLDELRGTLGIGKVLIEYFYNETCKNCTARAEMYKRFVGSNQFKGYVVLSYGVWNETADWVLDATGTQTDLSNMTDVSDLQKLFCGPDIIMADKPNACLLEEL